MLQFMYPRHFNNTGWAYDKSSEIWTWAGVVVSAYTSRDHPETELKTNALKINKVMISITM